MNISLTISPFYIYLFDHLNMVTTIFGGIALLSAGITAISFIAYMYTLSSMDSEDITLETCIKSIYSPINSINNHVCKIYDTTDKDKLDDLNFKIESEVVDIIPKIRDIKELLQKAENLRKLAINGFLVLIASLTLFLLVPTSREAYKYLIYSQLGSIDVSILQYYLDAIQVLINRL